MHITWFLVDKLLAFAMVPVSNLLLCALSQLKRVSIYATGSVIYDNKQVSMYISLHACNICQCVYVFV